MLSDLGATVEIAGDGSVAVAMFTEALHNALSYDVLLMDCQVRTFLKQYHAKHRLICFKRCDLIIFDVAGNSIFFVSDAGDEWL